MKLSCKCRYAVRAVFDIAFHQGSAPAQIKDISERQHIPPRFLEQIFQDLKRAGLIQSKRGPRGGYRLGKPASDIRLGDILRALQGPVDLSPRENEGSDAEATGNLVTRRLFESLSEKIQACFDEVTIEELCAQGVAHGIPRHAPGRYVYSI